MTFAERVLEVVELVVLSACAVTLAVAVMDWVSVVDVLVDVVEFKVAVEVVFNA